MEVPPLHALRGGSVASARALHMTQVELHGPGPHLPPEPQNPCSHCHGNRSIKDNTCTNLNFTFNFTYRQRKGVR